MEILKTIGAGIASVGIFIGSLFGFTPQTTEIGEELGRSVNAVSTNTYVLAGSGISSSATTITLTSFTAPVSGIPYTMANFGDGASAKGYLTIEPGSRTRQETVSFTGITQNSDGTATLTGVSRGLLPFEPYTASSTYAVAHNGGSQVVVSNPPQLYDAIYDYVDSAVVAGAVDGSITAKGIYETATGVEAASTTAIGGGNTSATLALTTLISTSTGGTAYTIPVTGAAGALDARFMTATVKREYTSVGTTTWTKPTGLSMIYVQAWGGGGSGASGNGGGTELGGGGGGGYCDAFFHTNDLSSSHNVVVGSGASTTVNVPGGTGSTTAFGTLLFAFGGGGGGQGGTGAAGGGGGGCFGAGTNASAATAGIGGDMLATNGSTSTVITTIAYQGAGGGGVADGGTPRSGGNTVWGGGGGASALSGVPAASSTSLYGGDGGASSGVTNGNAGEQPGGGGGASFGGNGGRGGHGKVVIYEIF